MTDLFWRPLTTIDLPAVETIAAVVHPGFFESPEVFAERLRLYPEGAHLLDADGEPGGYVISHPWLGGSLPPLDTRLGTLPSHADAYYIHDLALLPAWRGTGAARRIVQALIEHADRRGFAGMGLVAVNGSQPFWERLGFRAEQRPELRAKLLSYEPGARYMVRPRD